MSERNEVSGFSKNSEIVINELIEEQKRLRETTNDLVNAANSSIPDVDSLKNSIEQLLTEKLKGFEKLMEQKMVNIKGA